MNLHSIVAASASLWERLSDRSLHTRTTPQSAARLAQWQATLTAAHLPDSAARLAKRLAWDNLTPDSIQSALGEARWDEAQPLPGWAALLAQASQTAHELAASEQDAQSEHRALNADNPIQFEELLLPLVIVAARQLRARVRPTTYTAFSPAAHADLERGLLARLCRQALPSQQFSFSLYRAFYPPMPNEAPRARYRTFVQSLLADGLCNLWEDYMALARLLAQTATFWVEATAELLERFEADWPRLQAEFNLSSATPSVTAVQVSLSDPHRSGRMVSILTLEAGAKLVYKPRSLGLDRAFSQLLAWINAPGDLLALRPIMVLDCGTHGWMEYVEHRACQTEDEVRRYYERSGQMLCLAYLLYGADIHAENIIASGEHPVFIDLEMIFQANLRRPLDPPGLGVEGGLSALQQRVLNSVGRTLLLPAWVVGPSGRAWDVSGLGAVTESESAYQRPHWQNVNTDTMALEQHYPTLKPGHNAPKLGDQFVDPNDYLTELTTGFEQMYHWLMARRADVPLQWFAGQPARFLMRPTQLYFMVLDKALNPHYQHTGPDRDIQLDSLTRMFLRYAERPTAWPIARAEINALFQGDVPYFAYTIDSVDLPLGDGVSLENFFEKSGYQLVRERLADLSEDDLRFQLALIRGTMHTRVAAVAAPSAPIDPQAARLLSNDALIEHAVRLGDELERHALASGDAVGWLGYHFLPRAGRYQMQPLDSDLYNGVTGIALFLAALEKTVGGAGRYRALALAGLSDLRKVLAAPRPEQVAYARLGGGEGLGSTVYGLLRVGELLGEVELIEAARRLAQLITPALIQNDKDYDTLSGAAGALLCLLALYETTADQHALEMAVACGEHLLKARAESDKGVRAWPTLAGVAPVGQLPCGMAHGAAGIAYALLRLARTTKDTTFTAAAAEAIAHEANAFMPEHGNWPDFRWEGSGATTGYIVAWCYGAPGIMLARLGGLDVLDTPAIRNDIAIAIATTLRAGAAPMDQCCCGTCGRAEALLVASEKLRQPALAEQARRLTSWMVEHSQATGSHQLLSGLSAGSYHPGFFQGTTGIGYHLLRLVYPYQLPSILAWE